KTTSRLVTSNSLNLSLEEMPSVDEEQERLEWTRLVELNLHWEGLIQSGIEDKQSKVDIERVKELTFLIDGRLPGEPKFRAIELHYDQSKNEKSSSLLDLEYFTQVCVTRNDFHTLI